MTQLSTITDVDEAMTSALAHVFAAMLSPGDTIALRGPVGAGKSHFARSFIRARLGNPVEEVPSPTFTLVQTYPDPRGTEIWHADLYRLGDVSEVAELGLEDALSGDIALIEWPERGGDLPGALTLMIEPDPDDADLRRILIHGDEVRWGLVPRLVKTAKLLHRAGWADASVTPLAGDASSRRYFRVAREEESAVLMDDSPGATGPYVAMTQWLRDRDFLAPDILAADEAEGLLLMQDLGDDLVARVLEQEPALAPVIYGRMTDLLVSLHKYQAPDHVLRLDGPELAHQVGLFAEFYPDAAGTPGLGGNVAQAVQDLHGQLCADAMPVLGLRDFHVENIVWRGDEPLGLLDFQDAVEVHPAYDLVSALQDARRDVAEDIEQVQIARYVAATGFDEARFRAAYALLGAQRSLRIMGIFTRLCIRDGKPRYLAFMPRVWQMIQRNIAHPALAPLARALAGIAAPTPDVIERIAAQCPNGPKP